MKTCLRTGCNLAADKTGFCALHGIPSPNDDGTWNVAITRHELRMLIGAAGVRYERIKQLWALQESIHRQEHVRMNSDGIQTLPDEMVIEQPLMTCPNSDDNCPTDCLHRHLHRKLAGCDHVCILEDGTTCEPHNPPDTAS